jgi:hypothetical protein
MKKTSTPNDIFPLFIKQMTGYECIKEYRFDTIRRWRIDYYFPELTLALEVEGGVYSKGRHVRPSGFIGDVCKYNAMTMMGIALIRVLPKELMTQKTIDMIKNFKR